MSGNQNQAVTDNTTYSSCSKDENIYYATLRQDLMLSDETSSDLYEPSGSEVSSSSGEETSGTQKRKLTRWKKPIQPIGKEIKLWKKGNRGNLTLQKTAYGILNHQRLLIAIHAGGDVVPVSRKTIGEKFVQHFGNSIIAGKRIF